MNNYAYITLLSNDNYVPGVVLLKATLDAVNTKYPLIVLLPNKLSDASMDVLNKLGVETRVIDKIYMPEQIYEHNKQTNPRQAEIWKDTLSKFVTWTFEEFDKIILIDCDVLILRNLDDLFEKPHLTAALDGEYFNLWPTFPHFNTGLVVIKPNKEDFNAFLKFAEDLDPATVKDDNGQPYPIADQELLNLYYKDWVNKPELHLNKYYDIFAPHMFASHFDDVIENAYFVHFTGIKPWQITEDTKTSPLLLCEALNYRDYKTYAYAAAIIEITIEALTANKNVEFGIDDPYTKLHMVNLLVNRFQNIDAAVEIARTIPEYVEMKVLSDLKKAKDNKQKVLDLLAAYYSNNATSGIASLHVYGLIANIEKAPLTDTYITILDILKNAEEGAVKSIEMD